MSTSQEKTNNEEVYDNIEEVYSYEDRELIISLLNEYSHKLLRTCEQIEIKKQRLTLIILAILGSGFSVILLLLSLLKESTSSLSLYFSIDYFKFAVIISLFSIFFLFVIATYFENKRRLELFFRDAKILSLKLEKVIRFTSQVQEHVLINLAGKIELDLRLSDAESSLENYITLVRTETFDLRFIKAITNSVRFYR